MQRSQFRINSNQIITNNEYHVELIKDSDVVIDAGANAGIFSVFAAIKHPEATIYAFEPTPFTFDILKKNTQYYPNIRCFNAALGDKCGPTTIVEAPRPTMNFVGVGGIPIEMRTIDSLGIPLNFLKMDTEGYEANILKGATETIRKYKPIIAMSAYHKPEDKVELPKLLNSISPYDCELRHDCEEEFICKPL
jgi:FkbM family methyltransferase